MRRCALFLCLASALLGGCERSSPTAPRGSMLTISATPDRIAADGTSTIVVVALKSDGFPVNEGSTVFFSTNRGLLPSSAPTDRTGRVQVVLRGNDDIGAATIRANAGAAGEAMVDVQIGIFASSVTLQSTPSSMPETGGSVELLALVRDDLGQPLESAQVNFSTAVGTLASGGGFIETGADGSARDTLTAAVGELDIITGDTFDVRVEVGGGTGNLITGSDTITIQRLPVADFTFNVSGLTVIFDDTSTGRPTMWRWDFGDGNSSTLQNPTHTYATVGTYTVTLTISNSLGEDRRSRIVAVTGNNVGWRGSPF